jgi:1,4-dihydroxy-6-naphthoate synthase
MKIRIGISPCPNDTYIFEAIYHQKVALKDTTFEFVFEDVETLNEMASKQALDMVKISYAHYFSIIDQYCMLRSGGALGNGVGPLLIAKTPISIPELINSQIAVPGKHTTAHFLLSFAWPQLKNKRYFRFEKIEEAILQNIVDAGVIIHENRFTYQEKGLHLLMDLGQYWETQTALPIPLGGIAISRTIPHDIQLQINALLKSSIEWANQQPSKINEFISLHAQEMNEEVMKQHISLYVNEYSLDVGMLGEQAVHKMKEVLNISSNKPLFI